MRESELGEVNILLHASSIMFTVITQLKRERIDVEGERSGGGQRRRYLFWFFADRLCVVSAVYRKPHAVKCPDDKPPSVPIV